MLERFTASQMADFNALIERSGVTLVSAFEVEGLRIYSSWFADS